MGVANLTEQGTSERHWYLDTKNQLLHFDRKLSLEETFNYDHQRYWDYIGLYNVTNNDMYECYSMVNLDCYGNDHRPNSKTVSTHEEFLYHFTEELDYLHELNLQRLLLNK